MNNNSNNYGDCGTTCSECGRPWAICKQDGGCGCNKCKDIKFCEYGRMANGCIREKQPGCPMQAVIPSVTVESIEGIKNLADCLVHVSDINTSFYIDDKHRPLITWAGPIDIPGYDMEGNPNNYRDQIVTDVANQIAVIYDKSGKGYLFGLAENIDLQEQVNNKLDAMVVDGTFDKIINQEIFGELNSDVEKLKKAVNGKVYLGCFFETPSLKVSAYKSNDCVNFEKLDISFPFTQRDVSFATYNGKFYFCKAASGYNDRFELHVTSDFANWETHIVSFTGLTGENTWAPEISIFEDGSACVTLNNNAGTETDIMGKTITLWDCYILKCANIESYKFDNPVLMQLTTGSNRNHIDAQISKLANKYWLIVKNDHAKVLELWESDDLDTWTIRNTNVTNSSLLVEGGSLVFDEKSAYIVADAYVDGQQVAMRCDINDFPNFNSKLVSPVMLRGQRHGRVNLITDDACIDTINRIHVFAEDYKFKKIEYGYKYLAGSNAGYWNLPDLPVIDKYVYGMAGTHNNVHITNPFGCEKMLIKWAGTRGNTLTITHIDDVKLDTPIKVINSGYTNDMIVEIPIATKQRSANITDITLYENLNASGVTGSTNFTVKTCYGHKVNNMVTINLTLTCTADYTTQQWVSGIATLPDSFKPITEIAFINNIGSNAIRLNASGAINGNINCPANTDINLIATYLTDIR